ncbi:MAG: mechanosensitive ion channel family protein [Oligoflexia bacterium]|nr:mechanosensitive ion channel family protein [Oligoflexia bacterium]
MNIRIQQPWIPLERLEAVVRIDVGLVILSAALGSWLIYKIFFKALNEDRHRNLRELFWNLWGHVLATSIFAIVFWNLLSFSEDSPSVRHLAAYVGLIALLWGAVVLIKSARILAFEYLFLGHMKQGVPLLTVNLVTLVLSLLVTGWIATEVFGFKVSSLLATSAIFSVVIGLALQDTLGNLFAGAAMQFDKPYEIGDWVEIYSNNQTWIGQVYEISWRATVLLGLSDEFITIPNRIVAQSQVSNFAAKRNPIARRLTFRLPYGVPEEKVKRLMIQSALKIHGVQTSPSPMVVISEAAESWMLYKLVYFVENYGQQWIVADKVFSEVVRGLTEEGVSLAHPKLSVNLNQGHL